MLKTGSGQQKLKDGNQWP